MLKPLALLLATFTLTAAHASGPVDMSKDPGFAAKVEKLAAAYDLQKQLNAHNKHAAARAALGLAEDADFRPMNCDDGSNGHGSSCVDAVCKKLGTFGCDEMSELERVGQLCRGNINSGCLDFVCKKLGTFGCDEASELERVGQLCRGVWGMGCIDTMCKRLGTFGCDEASELERVGGFCRGVHDAGCIDSVCNRLGTFGCDEASELERVANSCK